MKHTNTCFVKDCHDEKIQNQKLYCFPQIVKQRNRTWKSCQANKSRRETWLRNIGCELPVIPAKIYICGKHFVHGNDF